jgi:hypothetical protein
MIDVALKLWAVLLPLSAAHTVVALLLLAVIALTGLTFGVRAIWRGHHARVRAEELASDPRQDHALRSRDGDQLDRGPFIDSLFRALVRSSYDAAGEIASRESTGFVVGLTGPWGLGKSSILNMLHKDLAAAPKVAVAFLNPWLFKDRDELLKAYFNSLRGALGTSTDEKARALLESLERYRQAIDWVGNTTASLIDSNGFWGGIINAGWAKLSGLVARAKARTPRSPAEERKALERKIALANIAIVILIDELDRVEDSEVRAVAQLIKAVGDIRGISYLVAYDPARVADALGRGEGDERRRSGYLYLEKIIQLPIPVRPLFADDVDALLQAALTDFGITLARSPDRDREAILNEIKRAVTTAREVKRLIGAFSILEEALRGEICPYDMLGYAWILIKSDAVKEAVTVNIDRIVDDPGEYELILRLSGTSDKATVPDTLGAIAEPFEPLLKLLFPRFGPSRTLEGVQNRISRRRNLVRLLYLGNPPGMIRRADVERIWGLPDLVSMGDDLYAVLLDGRMPQLLDRLDDLLPDLHPFGDRIFWPALSTLFYRREDWITRADVIRTLADDAATTLMRLGLRNPSQISRVVSVFEELRAGGDLVFTPWILRKHLFAHGFVKFHRRESADMIFDIQRTQELLDIEALRYRDVILSGEALRRLPNLEAIYVLSNTGRWDDALRASLTDQLSSLDAIGTFAALSVPPGYSTDRASLHALFDLGQVERRLQQEIERTGWPGDPWVADCLRRFQRILQGKDDLFGDQE